MTAHLRTITAGGGTYLREQGSGMWKLHVIVSPHQTLEILLPASFFDNYFDRKA